MTSVGDVRAALEDIRERLEEERKFVLSTMRPLVSAHMRLIRVWQGSKNKDLYRAAMQANSATDDVIKALQHINFADRQIEKYLTSCL